MNATFSSFSRIVEQLDRRGFFHMDLSLDRMHRALTALHLQRAPFVVVQVLGTNGKGSTASFLDSLARAHGLHTGLYTSPHFVSPAERIRIDGRPLHADLWPDLACQVDAACPDLTYVEFLTVLALLAFRQQGVQLAILEAGLGGRHDATTATAADALCYAPVALDHAAILGPRLEDIARDKADAIRAAVPVISAPQFPVVQRILAQAAARQDAPLSLTTPLPASVPLGLAGEHQHINAAVALRAWQSVAPRCGVSAQDSTRQALGLQTAFIPGRLQYLPACPDHPALLLDGAHNPHGMQALTHYLAHHDHRPPCAIFSCLKDKDWQPAAMLLRRTRAGAPIFIPQLHNERAADAAEVAAVLNRGATAPVASALPHVQAALQAAADCAGTGSSPVIMSGSLYLLSEFFTLFPRYLDRPCPAPTRTETA